jgi:Chaperone of endosialidase
MPYLVKGELRATQRVVAGNTALDSTAIGVLTLDVNSGIRNVAVGSRALSVNTTGTANTAVGVDALSSNVVGALNTGVGFGALFNNLGSANTAIGEGTLFSNTSGSSNTALGQGALILTTTGGNNSGAGTRAGQTITTGSNNTCVGTNADVNNPVATGRIAIGINTAGAAAFATVNDGLFFPPALATAAGAAVQYNAATGQMGPVASSLAFKEDVVPLDVDTSRVFDLRPVSYKHKISGHREFGFIAEEVDELFPQIVPKTAEGAAFSVNYDRIVVLLLEEVRKLRDEVRAGRSTNL